MELCRCTPYITIHMQEALHSRALPKVGLVGLVEVSTHHEQHNYHYEDYCHRYVTQGCPDFI